MKCPTVGCNSIIALTSTNTSVLRMLVGQLVCSFACGLMCACVMHWLHPALHLLWSWLATPIKCYADNSVLT